MSQAPARTQLQNAPYALALPTILIGVLSAAFLAFVWPEPLSANELTPVLLFAAIYALLAFIEIPVGPSLSISAEPVSVLLGLLTFGPAVAVTSTLLGSAVTMIRRRRKPLRAAFTVSQFGICMMLAVLVHERLSGATYDLELPARIASGEWMLLVRYAGSALLAMSAYIALNNAFLAAYIRRETGGTDTTWSYIRSELFGVPLFVAVAIAATIASVMFGWAVTGLFALPAMAIIWAAAFLQRARMGRGRISVSDRLTAFLAGGMAVLFLVISAIIMLTSREGYMRAT
jgi:hypothetical protein